MRPVNRGAHLEEPIGIKIEFKHYREAKSFLETNTGDYCHFCEKRVNNALAIEHIEQQGLFTSKVNDWDNFLLICTNCNSCKPQNSLPTQPMTDHYYWPHLNNTILTFDYDLEGTAVPVPNSTNLTQPIQTAKAQKLIDFYKPGLETNPITGNTDGRHRYRKEALRFAKTSLLEYLARKINVDAIIRQAVLSGFFSIWIKVFDRMPEIRKALIDCPDFKLTGHGFFDAQYQPLKRILNDF